MNSSTVQCLECSESFKSLNLHLKKHGMKVGDYLEKHPGADISSQEYREKLKAKMTGREITWKNKISSATKQAMSRSDVREKFMDYISSRDISGEKNPFFGRHHTDEMKRSISENEERSRKISEKKFEWWSDGRKGKTVEEIFGEEIGKRIRETKSEHMQGEKNPAYGKVYLKTGRKVGRYKGKLFRSVFEYYFYRHLESLSISLDDVEYEPVAIKYKIRGKTRTYHPDFYVRPLKLLVEIKSTYALEVRKKGRRIIKEKKRAAEKFCSDIGLTYKIMTEKDYSVRSYKEAYDDKNVVWIKR